MANLKSLVILRATGSDSAEACAQLLQQIKGLGPVNYTVCGSISFCVEYVRTGVLQPGATGGAGNVQQVISAVLMVLVDNGDSALDKP